jgi:hypothetical protein
MTDERTQRPQTRVPGHGHRPATRTPEEMSPMDGYRFDTLATGSRRPLIGGLLGGATLFGLGRGGGFATQGKTTICHQTDSGYTVITVANPALDAHYRHGDFAYTDCCTDAECAGDAICEAGACVAPEPEPCPPFTARGLDGVCRNPCPTWRGTCGTVAGEHDCNCWANYAGEALCYPGATHTFSNGCQSDQDCRDDEKASPDEYTYVCLQGPPGNPIDVCYGDAVICPVWTSLPD